MCAHYLASAGWIWPRVYGPSLVVEMEDRAVVSAQAHRPPAGSRTVDAADAEAICEAVTGPNMRFVATSSTRVEADVTFLHT
jgi:hypothetical protein